MTTKKIAEELKKNKPEGLELMKVPFPQDQISALPKPSCKLEEWKSLKRSKCDICGGYHPKEKTIHLDYVGHAALTARLLECDPKWNWEPLAVGEDGYPVIDRNGGMWIKLTVCGVTRLGYGDAQGKTGGDAMKERIGDALRNASMRFGAALDLWHKGEHPLFNQGDSDTLSPSRKKKDAPSPAQKRTSTPASTPTAVKDVPSPLLDSPGPGEAPEPKAPPAAGESIKQSVADRILPKIHERLEMYGCPGPGDQDGFIKWATVKQGLSIPYIFNNCEKLFNQWVQEATEDKNPGEPDDGNMFDQ